MLWMAPSLEENTVFNEGERKQELPAASRKLSLFSFASFPLFTGMREAGPIHPHSSPSLGLMSNAPRPPQMKISLHGPTSTVPAGLPSFGITPGGQRLLAMGVDMGYQDLPPLQSHPHPPGALHQKFSAIKEKLRHRGCVTHTCEDHA